MSLKEPPLTFYYPIKGNFKSEIANTLMQSKIVLSLQHKGTPHVKKNVFFRALPKLPLPPPPLLSGNLYIFFSRHKGIYKVYFLIRARPSPPPHSGNARKKTFFFT